MGQHLWVVPWLDGSIFVCLQTGHVVDQHHKDDVWRSRCTHLSDYFSLQIAIQLIRGKLWSLLAFQQICAAQLPHVHHHWMQMVVWVIAYKGTTLAPHGW